MKTLRYLLALMLLPSIVFAADLKITQMPAASSVAASDLVNVVQGSASRKATVGQIALGGVGYAANAGTVANTIPVRNGSGKVPGSITGDADGSSRSDCRQGRTFRDRNRICGFQLPDRVAGGKRDGGKQGNVCRSLRDNRDYLRYRGWDDNLQPARLTG